jgi:hypothetical protein
MYARPLLVVAVAVVAAAAPASAQSFAPVTARTLAVRTADDNPDAARIRAMIEKADEALVAGRLAEARRTYRAVIEAQHAAGQYAGEALWHLASAHFFSDDSGATADVLDELATEAARFGDPSMELRATFESAVLYQSMHRSSAIGPRLARVKALLQSPAISATLKAEISQRMAAN